MVKGISRQVIVVQGPKEVIFVIIGIIILSTKLINYLFSN